MGALLLAMLLVPFATIAVLYLMPRDRVEPLASRLGFYAGAVVLVLAVAFACAFDYTKTGYQGSVNWNWIPALHIRFHLGVDGISLPLVLLTVLLSVLCFFYSIRHMPEGGSQRAYTALLLLLEIGMLGTFLAADLILFFVFFEIVLLPMWALIAYWGADGAKAAANKFILYTLLGSAVMVVGFLVVYAYADSFDMAWLTAHARGDVPKGAALTAFALIALGFAVKTPMFPLHTWLPDAHTAAPTTGSVLLAGVLLKMGTYGFVRIAVPILPQAAPTYAPALAAFGVVGVIYGSLACLSIARKPDGDLKRLIAYSSIGHMGFVLLGIGSLTTVGMNAALFASVAHGLITGLLFFLVGGLKVRVHSAKLDDIGRALYRRAPKYAALIAFAAMASLGLPGLAGFWGEVLALFSATKPGSGLTQGSYIAMASIAALGLVLTATYLLAVVRRVCMGPAATQSEEPVTELTAVETATWTPLVLLTLAAGLWPALLLGITNPAVRVLMKGV
ncbi:NADH-quinone oxidoreductase subunit M [Catenulispora sp. NF23]|uniref:NADH-quinone oxidoreductase subunit M n=1 Tax=Catenulispora pinistramenti TaxID=2705254 RepID=A0ABS5L8F7_9ACTN|nr:NADH-quinone oxidoreductase subunit M [Catenulispora pinistramenti]MBS2539482.1 NADH-quinone oxidoreductase subunit M [Catenulispora pinistramenti]MBS2554355.1 NADH-quinone oxidoreductase subunit M [Catenulispora pinistramenti]